MASAQALRTLSWIDEHQAELEDALRRGDVAWHSRVTRRLAGLTTEDVLCGGRPIYNLYRWLAQHEQQQLLRRTPVWEVVRTE